MNNGRWIATLAILVVMGFIYTLTRSGDETSSSPQQEQVVQSEPVTPSPAPTQESSTPEAAAVTTQAPSQADLLQNNFIRALSGLQSCFKQQSAPAATNGQPTMENWLEVLKPELGESVLRSEDWSNTHITLPNGERRRIRIETEMTDDDRVVRRLKYASVDAEDLPVPIQLPDEQTEDPNDAYIASLEKEGEVTMTERAERLYFQDGSEVFVVQRNDHVAEIEINKAGSSYRCWNLDEETSQCECL